MAIHISDLTVLSYRGITNFSVGGLGDVNIITGENNCGKTSFLEALQVLHKPFDFGNIVMISRQRDRFRAIPTIFTQSQYSSFLNVFNKFKSELWVSMSCKMSGCKIHLSLTGRVEEALLSEDQLAELKRVSVGNKSIPAIDEEVKTFFGRLSVEDSALLIPNDTVDVMLNKYSRIIRYRDSKDICPMNYISPIDHAVADRFNEITRNKSLREDVVKILQSSFDEDIEDLRTVEDDDGRIISMIEHSFLGDMPLSTYGDGIKKVIALVNAVATIMDGILLIDEYETAIHTKAMDHVFRFIIKLCMERNIQLFMTTHSDEALNKMLQCEDFLSNIRVITMLKNADNTTARVLDGRKALSVKNELGLELR
jgi:AAA15 family ATPase/GTPase